MERKKANAAREPGSDRVALAKVKANLSRYVLEVQTQRHAITITQHGRPAAILTAVPTAKSRELPVREPVDERALGALALRPPRGQGARDDAIRRALDEERSE